MIKNLGLALAVSLSLSACGQAPSPSNKQGTNIDETVKVLSKNSALFKLAMKKLAEQDGKVQAGTASDQEYMNSVAGKVNKGESSLETYKEFKQAKSQGEFLGSFKDWLNK